MEFDFQMTNYYEITANKGIISINKQFELNKRLQHKALISKVKIMEKGNRKT